MIKIRGLIIPDEDKKYVSELSKVNPFTYKNIDFRDRIPLKSVIIYSRSKTSVANERKKVPFTCPDKMGT